jgi:hypothetical protein
VDEVVLSGTPNPTRPGDPAQHFGPRRYLKAHRPGVTWHCATPADLASFAEQEAWDFASLAEQPTHVVIDTRDGSAVHRGADGGQFGRAEAVAYAAECNAAEGGTESHRVYLLAEAARDEVATLTRELLEVAA